MTNGIRIAKKPSVCRIRITPSILGKNLAATVLTNTQTNNAAHISNVPCHCL